jgi:hypothetical protein
MGNLIIIQDIFQNIIIATITTGMVFGIVTVTPTVVQVTDTMERSIFIKIGIYHQDHLLNFTFDGT